MFLKRLELCGFKSFADRLDLSFSNGITAIVGPNGCGKSNVSDAVRWVLGEQSAKQLRGAQMADVIFNGTESRKPLSYCEVSLIFDNTDKGLEIEYAEVVITRRLYRSGESEYYINRNACRLKDVVTLFQDTGIGKEGYSIVGQGRIDNILSGKPEERRSVFEEAAGIVKYKTRKLEAERKLSHTQDNLARISDIISTLEERIEPLAQQAETAKQYLSLHDTLRGLEVNFYLCQNALASERKQAHQLRLEGIEQEQAEKNMQVEQITAENEMLSQKLQDVEQRLADVRSKMLEFTAGSENIGGEQRVLAERLGNLDLQEQRINEELESSEQRKESMQSALSGDGNAETEKEKAIEQAKTEVAALENEIAQHENELNAEGEELEKAKQIILVNINKLSDVKANQSRYEAMRTNIFQRQEAIGIAIEKLLLAKTNIQSALDEQEGAASGFISEKTKIDQRKAVLKEKSLNLLTEREALEKKLTDGEARLQAMRSRIKMLEEMRRDYDGYNLSVKRILMRCEQDPATKSHVCGVLAQLISAPKEYECAVEAALGNAMQNIVTPNEQDAKELIEFLRRTDSGRATFLPISAIRGKTLTAQERAFLDVNGCMGVAAELVSFDGKYSEIVNSFLGRTVICKTMDVAVSIAKRSGHNFRLVTLEGDLINAGGSMTGGSIRSRSTSLLGREREIEQSRESVKSYENELIKLRTQLDEFNARKTAIEEGLRDEDDKLHKLDVTYARDNERLSSLKADMAASVENEHALLLEKEQLNDTLTEIQAELDKISGVQGDVEQFNTGVQDEVTKRQTEYNHKRIKNEQTAQELTNKRVLLAGLEKELEAMRGNAVKMQEQIDLLLARHGELLKQSEEIKRQRAEVIAKQESIAKEFENAQAGLGNASEGEKQLNAERDAISKHQHENDERRRAFEQEIFTAQERKHKEEMAVSKVDGDIALLEQRIWDEYELTSASAEEYRVEGFKITGVQGEINRLKKEINTLGTVNVAAIDEYVETREKFDSLVSQRADLQKAQADLNEIIQSLMKKMEKQFNEQFELINKHFSKTFSELFNGGRAQLKLENGENALESNIEIEAQPPGKSLQLISLLSGGEKALTAIAILFAMLKLKPTPFCILDEIEAALDEANVGNFATYLRSFSEKTQFIVITHRKPTMEEADSLYGVAMEEKGVSRMVSVKLT